MNREFTRLPGSTALSSEGFEVSVSGRIGLFMDWAKFPEGCTAEEQREIFARVIWALRFLEIPVGETEIDPSQKKWPLPPRTA